jgi:hypothetical protein
VTDAGGKGVPRWLAHFLLVVGWLLTPACAWGASYFGLWIGAKLGVRFSGPGQMVAVALGIAFLCGFVVLALWVRMMRRFPHWLAHRMAPRPSQENHATD